jgi:hypothetical protein
MNQVPFGVIPLPVRLCQEMDINHVAILMHLFELQGKNQNKSRGRVYTLAGKSDWCLNTYSNWCPHFPWMSERTIRRSFKELQTLGLIEVETRAIKEDGGTYRGKVMYARVTDRNFESLCDLTREPIRYLHIDVAGEHGLYVV